MSSAVHSAQPPNRRTTLTAFQRRIVIGIISVPALGTIVAFTLALAGFRPGWLVLAVASSMFALTSVSVEAGLHRYFAHRAFQAGSGIRALLGILGSMAAQGSPLAWAAAHRRHHKFSDGPGDPHSPRSTGSDRKAVWSGLWHAHVGWMINYDLLADLRYVPDLCIDRLVIWVSKHYIAWVALGLLLPTAISGALLSSWEGAALGFLWGGLVRVFVFQNLTWAVNSLAHTVGRRPYRTQDHSANILLLSIPTAGMSLHNNHHAFPFSATNQLQWWQLDPSAWVIWVLARLRLIHDVKTPPASLLIAKRRHHPRFAVPVSVRLSTGQNEWCEAAVRDISMEGFFAYAGGSPCAVGGILHARLEHRKAAPPLEAKVKLLRIVKPKTDEGDPLVGLAFGFDALSAAHRAALGDMFRELLRKPGEPVAAHLRLSPSRIDVSCKDGEVDNLVLQGLSLTEANLWTARQLSIGEKVEIQLDAQSAGECNLAGQIAWCRSVSSAGSWFNVGVAFEFTDGPKRERIAALLGAEL